MTTTRNPLARDLDDVLDRTSDLWETLRGERLFITGGTGFFGCWLLESFAWANARLSLGASVLALSRQPTALHAKAPHLGADAAITLVQGDVRTFEFPPGRFGVVIHAATDASVTLNRDEPMRMLDTIVAGTRRVLDFARGAGARRLLHTSSGAVYGRQPPELSHVSEDYAGAPDPTDPRSAYGEGKRMAELLCRLYQQEYGLGTVSARCFAFVGPYLPLDTHFAAGNFLRDRLEGRTIHVAGDGSARRSYLYASDLTVWLWTLLIRGEPGRAYNVGGEADLSIAELAGLAAIAGPGTPAEVRVANECVPGRVPERYVPSTRRAREELGLRDTVSVQDALARTLHWHLGRST